jgi:hypothetical protein
MMRLSVHADMLEAVLIALLLTTSGSPASPDTRAQVRSVEDALAVDPGATCLESSRLATQVRAWMELREIDERLVVDVRGDRDEPTRVSFTIILDDEVIAVRRFDSAPDTCADLHAVVGLAIALALDATVLETVGVANKAQAADEPSSDEDGDSKAEAEAGVQAELEVDPDPQRDWALRVSGEAGVSLGAPPGIGGYAALFLEAGWRERLDIRIGPHGGSSGPQPAGSESTLIWALAGRSDVCVGGRLRVVRPRGCLGVLLGAAFAEGRGFVEDRAARLPWVALPVGGDLRIMVAKRVELEIGGELLLNAVRPAFDFVDDSGFRQAARVFPRFAGTFGLGAVVTVW